jgi:hypothetical protein
MGNCPASQSGNLHKAPIHQEPCGVTVGNLDNTHGITATSVISGCVSRRASSSAGGTCPYTINIQKQRNTRYWLREVSKFSAQMYKSAASPSDLYLIPFVFYQLLSDDPPQADTHPRLCNTVTEISCLGPSIRCQC